MFKLVFIVIGIALVVAVYAAIYPFAVFPVNGGQLAHSLNKQVHAKHLECRKSGRGERSWVCTDSRRGDGSKGSYDVRLKDSDCWVAVKRRSGNETVKLNGCAVTHDFYGGLFGSG